MLDELLSASASDGAPGPRQIIAPFADPMLRDAVVVCVVIIREWPLRNT